MSRIGRNDPCPCGSGLKHKKCCLDQERANVRSLDVSRLRNIEERLAGRILDYMAVHYGEVSSWLAQYEYFVWPDQLPDEEQVRHELVQAFTPWIIYNWEPDLLDFKEAFGDELDQIDLPPMENAALRFLRTEHDRLSKEERQFIKLSCAAQFSFLKVLDVQRGYGMELEDMLTGERVFVQDVSASRMAFDGMILFTRVLKASEQVSMLAGTGMTALPPTCVDEIIELRNHIRKGMECLIGEGGSDRLDVAALGIDVRKDYALEIRERYHRIAAEIRSPASPILQNTDGEDIAPQRLVYDLPCTPREALDKLATLCNGETSDQLLVSMDSEFDRSGELETISFPWLVKRPAGAMLDNTVNGHLFIDGQMLVIEVNSHERAEAIQRKIKRRLGKHVVLRDIQELPFSPAGGPSSDGGLNDAEQEELMNDPEIRQQVEAMSRQHWQGWVDHPLPALHGQTPREAAQTPEGRERLEALFDEFAFRDEQLPTDGPMASFKAPIGELRKVLGLV